MTWPGKIGPATELAKGSPIEHLLGQKLLQSAFSSFLSLGDVSHSASGDNLLSECIRSVSAITEAAIGATAAKPRRKAQGVEVCCFARELVPLAGIEPALLAELDFEFERVYQFRHRGIRPISPNGWRREAGGI